MALFYVSIATMHLLKQSVRYRPYSLLDVRNDNNGVHMSIDRVLPICT